MSNVDTTRDAPRTNLPPVDPSVVIPESVRRAAAQAEAFYKQPPAAAPEPQPAPAVPPVEPVVQPAAAAPEPPPQVVAPAPVEPVQPAAPAAPQDDANLTAEQWRHRYLSMKGRYDQQQVTLGSMQEQMQELGNELVRTQQFIQRQPAQPPQPPKQTKLITAEDEQNYGTELIDLTRRAAAETVTPEIEALRNETQSLKQTIQQQGQRDLRQFLDRELPQWREINNSPRFKKWLNLPDIYSGSVRRQMLNVAYQAADAPRVKAFFDGFLREEQVTGNIEPVPPLEQAQTPPRQPAVPLANLAAPGRARPASGDQPTSVEKPVFTRKQIADFYADVRAQRWAGREAEKSAYEAQIFAAQNEGRVR